MKIDDIKAQLERVLPTQTDLFSGDILAVASIIRVGSLVTLTTTAPHGMVDFDVGVVVGAKSPTAISSLTRAGEVATAITATPNDLTQNFQETVIISGADQADYNGTKNAVNAPSILITSITRVGTVATVTTFQDHGFVVDSKFLIKISGVVLHPSYAIETDLLSVIDSKTFTFTVLDNPPTPVTDRGMFAEAIQNRDVFFFEVLNDPVTPATGTPILEEEQISNNGYDGRHTVLAPTPTTLTYPITTEPNSPAVGTALLHKEMRIGGMPSITRALQIYTGEDDPSKLWAYIIPGTQTTSKDRNTKTDATTQLPQGSEYRFTEIQTVSVIIVAIIDKDEISARRAYDLMEDVKRFLFKSLLRVEFPSNLSQRLFPLVSVGSNPISIPPDFIAGNAAVYTHQFNFETTLPITGCDAADPPDSIAVRCFDMTTRSDTAIKYEDSFNVDSKT